MVAVGGGRSEGRSGGDVGNLSACQLCRSRLIERNCDSIGMSPQCARVIYDQRNVPTCSLQETKIDALHQDMKQIKDTADARCGVCSAGLVFVEWRWRKLEAWKLRCGTVREAACPCVQATYVQLQSDYNSTPSPKTSLYCINNYHSTQTWTAAYYRSHHRARSSCGDDGACPPPAHPKPNVETATRSRPCNGSADAQR